MTIAYLVLSHRNPPQVLRLVRALAEGPAGHVLVRHDGRRSRLPASAIEGAGGEAIEDAIDVEWGRWSHVELILSCLREARRRLDPEWTLILSGQDYPLRPMAEIEADLQRSKSDARLGAVREVEPRRPANDDEFYLRCRYRHYARPGAIPDLPRGLRPLIYVREMPPLVGIRRIAPAPIRFYSSADWLTLGRDALEAVLEATRDRRLMRHFRRVAVPSESFFASVLLGDPSLSIERDHRRVARFSRPGGPHPDTLTSSDLDSVVASGADFARKFDAQLDSEVLDRLDERR
jgi:Core-2/I-Branching enzyme